jgi:uncharacterized membrane protein YhfC
MHVSIFSILFMAVSAVISIGLPIVLFVVFHKKFNAKFFPMIIGIAGFVLFALVLEQSVHSFVFAKFALAQNPPAFILYGAFMAGIFEETARFAAFKFTRKKYGGIGTGLAYGVGHGGIESVILVGLAMVNTLIFSISINAGNIETITGQFQGETLEQIKAQINALLATPAYLFLVSGVERVFAIALQISLSVIVFYSVHGKNKLWLYPLAVVLHAMIDVPAAAMKVGVIKNMYLVELCAFIGAVVLVIIAKRIHRGAEQDRTVD